MSLFIGSAAHLADKPLFEAVINVLCEGIPHLLAIFFVVVENTKGRKISGLKPVRKLDLGVP